MTTRSGCNVGTLLYVLLFRRERSLWEGSHERRPYDTPPGVCLPPAPSASRTDTALDAETAPRDAPAPDGVDTDTGPETTLPDVRDTGRETTPDEVGDGGRESSDGGADDRVPLDDLPSRMAEVYCGQIFSCCNAPERAALASGFVTFNPDSQQHCQDKYRGLLRTGILAPLRSGTEAGRVVYDPEAMADCLSEKFLQSCSEIPSDGTVPTSCDDAIEPNISAGASCNRTFECKTGTCYKDNPSDDTGVCRSLADKDESCANRACAEGLYCQSDTCTPKNSTGDACERDRECASGLCSDKKCVPKRVGAQRCYAHDQCKSRLCDSSGDSSEGTCLGVPVCNGK
ncbi:MAG: hypothetical protein ABEN55_13040 [Bradymonadaceae bacterium]